VNRCLSAVLVAAGLLAGATAAASEPHSATTFGASRLLSEGALALQLRDYAGGIRLTRAGLAEARSNASRSAGYSNLCAGLTGARRLDEAVAACDTALSLRPSNWRALSNRALAHVLAGRLVAARRDLHAALAHNPEATTLQRVSDLLAAAETEAGLLLADQGPPATTR